MNGAKRIVVHVDRLVLRDFGGRDPRALAAGFRHELGLLLGEARIARASGSLGHVESIRAGRVTHDPAKPRATGAAVARAVVRSFGR